MNSPDHNCGDCVHAMDGADNVLRCRIHSNALKCSPAAYADCKRFEREPGADSAESPAHRQWYDSCDWIMGGEGRDD